MDSNGTRTDHVEMTFPPAAYLAPALVLLITCAAFLPALQNSFVDWDTTFLVNNSGYRGVGLAELRWIFAEFHFGQYHPLVWLTLALDHLLWWTDPFGYHWTQILLHGANAILVYSVAFKLCAHYRGNILEPDEYALRIAAAIAALFFAVHPLRVEPVAWASARGEILGGTWALLSVCCYLRASSITVNSYGPWWMALSVCTYGLSLVSGPVGIALPVVLLALDHYPLGRLGGTRNWRSPEGRQSYLQKLPYVIVAIVAIVVGYFARSHYAPNALSPPDHTSSWLLHLLAAPGFYLWNTIAPYGLSPSYELPGSTLAASIIPFVALSCGVIYCKSKRPALFVGWICYVMLLVPLFRTEISGQDLIADRFAYLPAVALTPLIAAAALHCYYIWRSGRFANWLAYSAIGLMVLVAIGLGAQTRAQTGIWYDSETLWKHAAAVSRSSHAHHRLAILFETQGKYDEAVHSYQKLAAINPRRWDAHEKAALLLQKQGKINTAVEHFRRAIHINPTAIEARNHLATGLMTQGNIGEAVQHFRKVVELDPGRTDTRVKLATILALQGKLNEALDLLQKAVKAEPRNAKNLLKLGQVLAAQGNLEQAISYFGEAVRLQPEDAEIQESLGRALLGSGKKDEGAFHLREALRILKSSPVAR